MKLFLDSAKTDEIRHALQIWDVDGVTTNPRHVISSGKPFRTVIQEIAEIFDGTDKSINVVGVWAALRAIWPASHIHHKPTASIAIRPRGVPCASGILAVAMGRRDLCAWRSRCSGCFFCWHCVDAVFTGNKKTGAA